MRLAEFILDNIEPIMAEWETFARSIWPRDNGDPAELRDDATGMLMATVEDMRAEQSENQRHRKSEGRGHHTAHSQEVDSAAARHAVQRVHSGFDLPSLVAEYRALRASVIRLWRDSDPDLHAGDLNDLTRFYESMDQSLAEAVHAYIQHVERSRKLFLAILGHDLRTPLNAVSLSAQSLLLGGTLAEEDTPVADQIVQSSNHMKRMVTDLLDYTSTSLGQPLPIQLAPVDLAPLCRDVVGEQQSAHAGRDISLDIDGHTAGTWDTNRLRQALANLLGNALEHSPDDTPVRLRLHGGEEEVTLTIHNGGLPIPADELDTLFNPLVRGGTTGASAEGHLGLGLYIAREVIAAHNGQIEVASTAEDGTTFTLHLPRQ